MTIENLRTYLEEIFIKRSRNTRVTSMYCPHDDTWIHYPRDSFFIPCQRCFHDMFKTSNFYLDNLSYRYSKLKKEKVKLKASLTNLLTQRGRTLIKRPHLSMISLPSNQEIMTLNRIKEVNKLMRDIRFKLKQIHVPS